MMLGNHVNSINYTNHYFVEVRFESSNGVYSYDSVFLNRDDVLIQLNYLLTISTEWAIDWDSTLWEEFLAGFIYPDDFFPAKVVINRMAYIDSNSVFHFFTLSEEYTSTNHPELLL